MTEEFRYQQLEKWLLKGLQQQRWPLGGRLPSIRALCQLQQVSKATVLHAYQRLEAMGLIESRPKIGYFVLKPNQYDLAVPQTRGEVRPPAPATISEVFTDIMTRSAAFDLLSHQMPANQELLNQAPSSQTPGLTALNRSIGRALRRQRSGQSQYYDPPAGDEGFREQLALHYQRRGYACYRDQFCVTSGCQNALFLGLMATCQKGDVVAVESPCFYGMLQLLDQLELQVVEIPSSVTEGMDMAALAEALKQWPIRACVVSPAFSTPTGACLPDTARRTLLNLAEHYDLAIIEDDIYADTSFSQAPEPLKALDQNQRVILCSSFSKSLSRDLRLGWIAGGRWQSKIQRIKLVTQLASSRYLQQGVADFMQEGGYMAHIRRYKLDLRQRRDQLLQFLRHDWPPYIRFSQPNGGLALWLELKEDYNSLSVYRKALSQGIVITPGALFSVSGQYHNCLRLSFAHNWTPARVKALKQLAQL